MLVILRWDVDVPAARANAVALLGRRGGGAADRRAPREARATREDPPQMIFMLRSGPSPRTETARDGGSGPGARPVIVPGRHVEEPYASLLSGTHDPRPVRGRDARPASTRSSTTGRSSSRGRSRGAFPGAWPHGLRLDPGPDPRPVRALRRLRQAGRASRRAPYAASVAYFASLGLGFIAVELSLLQHLTLLLGHPIFTLSILLFTLLAAGGVGSALERPLRHRPRLPA